MQCRLSEREQSYLSNACSGCHMYIIQATPYFILEHAEENLQGYCTVLYYQRPSDACLAW